jgi:hypothetical protein
VKANTIPHLILTALIFGSCTPSISGTPLNPSSIEPQEAPSETHLSTPIVESAIPEDTTEANPSLPIPALSAPQILIETAKDDLAGRLSIADTQINLINIDQVLWSDTSLGCPQVGNNYAQIQTPGYLIKLAYAGNEFEYHANLHGFIFYCENPTPPISGKSININP